MWAFAAAFIEVLTFLVILYNHTLSFAAAVIVMSLFILATIIHSVQFYRYRAWYMVPVIVGGIFESIAYMCRTIICSSLRPFTPYIISSVLTLVARAFSAATIYMILGRIVRLLQAEHHFLIPVNRLSKLFICLEIMSFQVQGAGAGMQAVKEDILQRAGEIVIVAVLVSQIIIFCLFLSVTLVFHRRTLKQPTHVSLGPLQWELHLGGLYGAGVLLLVRDIVRAVEYIQGHGGYIHKHGYFLYVFDAAPMFGVMLVMAVIYAPCLLQQRQGGELEEATEPPSHEGTFRVKA